MSEQQPKSLIDFVDTPAVTPIEIPCVQWKQANYAVYSGICPKCRPGLSLAAIGDKIRTEGHGHIHLNEPGCIICKCGTYLKLVFAETHDGE